jgi:glycosyltransferase involved in cell wall biosynthesis
VRVSCLMVTSPVPERLEAMTGAVEAYTRQTHPDRELIVVIDNGEQRHRDAVAAAIARFGRSDMKVVMADRQMKLGALRNLSVDQASGEYLCQWDDDDLHHPQRIAAQLAGPARGDCAATIMRDLMLYDQPARKLYWTNWAATPATGHPGTVLCLRTAMPRYPEEGPDAHGSEDRALLEALCEKHKVDGVGGAAHLYVYVTHGLNISPPAQLAMLRDELSISRGLLQRREAALREGLRPFALEGVTVEGSNGPAFTL